MEVIQCSHETTLADLCGAFKSMEKMSCCFYLHNTQHLREEILLGLSHIKKSPPMDPNDILTVASSNSNPFTPVFIHMAPTLNNDMFAARMKFRTMSLAAPTPYFLSSYIELSDKIEEKILQDAHRKEENSNPVHPLIKIKSHSGSSKTHIAERRPVQGLSPKIANNNPPPAIGSD